MQGSVQFFVKVENEREKYVVDTLCLELDSPQGNMSTGPVNFTGNNSNTELELDILLSSNNTEEMIMSRPAPTASETVSYVEHSVPAVYVCKTMHAELCTMCEPY